MDEWLQKRLERVFQGFAQAFFTAEGRYMRTRHLVAMVAWDEQDDEAIVECVGDTLDEQIDFLHRMLMKLQEQRGDLAKLEATDDPSLKRQGRDDLDDFDDDEEQDDEPWDQDDV